MRTFVCTTALLFVGPAGIALAQQPDTIFERGQQIEMRTSADNGWRACVVTDPGGSNRVARADCEEHPTPRYTYPAGEEIFQAMGTSDVRRPGSCTTTSPYANERVIRGCGGGGTGGGGAGRGDAAVSPATRAAVPARTATTMPPTTVPPPPAIAERNASLPLGEYACIGAGTTQLAGMGTKLLPGGRYSDLEGREFGTYRIVGNTIVFTGGVHGGKVGRDIKNNGYNIGAMVSCQKW